MFRRIPRWLPLLAAACFLVLAFLFFNKVLCPASKRPLGKNTSLPLPSTFLPERLPEFQKILSDFLQHGDYLRLGWNEDRGLRDTGPFINKKPYGVHPTVKIYYSPAS